MMANTAETYNMYVMKKLTWMSRQFGRYNDPNSIIYWANAMIAVKNLLFTRARHQSIDYGQNKAQTACKYTASKPQSISFTRDPSFLSASALQSCHTTRFPAVAETLFNRNE